MNQIEMICFWCNRSRLSIKSTSLWSVCLVLWTGAMLILRNTGSFDRNVPGVALLGLLGAVAISNEPSNVARLEAVAFSKDMTGNDGGNISAL